MICILSRNVLLVINRGLFSIKIYSYKLSCAVSLFNAVITLFLVFSKQEANALINWRTLCSVRQEAFLNVFNLNTLLNKALSPKAKTDGHLRNHRVFFYWFDYFCPESVAKLCCNLPAFIFIPAGNTWRGEKKMWASIQIGFQSHFLVSLIQCITACSNRLLYPPVGWKSMGIFYYLVTFCWPFLNGYENSQLMDNENNYESYPAVILNCKCDVFILFSYSDRLLNVVALFWPPMPE